MNRFIFKTLPVVLAVSTFFTQCRKSTPELIGSESNADFSFRQKAGSDTLPYAYDVIFTNNSAEGFLYQWNFGDNSALSSETNPVHRYKAGGTFNVTLTSVGTYGNDNITKVVSVADACQNQLFNAMTNCSFGEWIFTESDDAIKIFYPDGVTVFFSGPAVDCQLDDVFKFNANGDFGYEAENTTYNQTTQICGDAMPNASSFKLIVTSGVAPKIKLDTLEDNTQHPFIGINEAVVNNEYTVESYSSNSLILRATLLNGKIVQLKLKKKTILTIDDIKNILTGGNTRSWKLDPAAGANSIIVGTEANPGLYYGGGPLEPNCQTDDVYTFSANNTVNYNANGSTFNGGNIAPNYNCGADRSFNTPFVFGPVAGGGAGLAQIQLPNIPPAIFIGTTDVPTENLYRIIEITPSRMTLRAGTGAGVVFQFKFVRQ